MTVQDGYLTISRSDDKIEADYTGGCFCRSTRKQIYQLALEFLVVVSVSYISHTAGPDLVTSVILHSLGTIDRPTIVLHCSTCNNTHPILSLIIRAATCRSPRAYLPDLTISWGSGPPELVRGIDLLSNDVSRLSSFFTISSSCWNFDCRSPGTYPTTSANARLAARSSSGGI
jgi:hypothetical protein